VNLIVNCMQTMPKRGAITDAVQNVTEALFACSRLGPAFGWSSPAGPVVSSMSPRIVIGCGSFRETSRPTTDTAGRCAQVGDEARTVARTTHEGLQD
jgi:hypothetical protein